jgi:hypothetical protein
MPTHISRRHRGRYVLFFVPVVVVVRHDFTCLLSMNCFNENGLMNIFLCLSVLLCRLLPKLGFGKEMEAASYLSASSPLHLPPAPPR